MAMQIMDFRVHEGVRTLERQRELFKNGASQTLKSKHLVQADGYGHAVDLYPYPIDMKRVNNGNAQEIVRFGLLAGLMHAAAIHNKVKIVWGADWNLNGQTLDHSLFDGPHFQIML